MDKNTSRNQIDNVLTNFAQAYVQDDAVFVGTRYFPVIPVSQNAGKFKIYPQGSFNRPVNSKRAEDGVANTIGFKNGYGSYTVDDDAIRTFISDKEVANTPMGNRAQLQIDGTRVVTNALLINKELEFKDRFLTAGKWAKDMVGSASPTGTGQFLKWSDDASDPIADILGQKVAFSLATGGYLWNKALMTLDVYTRLMNHPAVLARITGGATTVNPAIAAKETIMRLLEVEELEIMRTVVNTAANGLENADGIPLADNQFAAEGVLMLNYVERNIASTKTPTAAAGFHWNEFVGLGVDNGPAVRRYPGVEGRRGEFVEAEYALDVQMVAPDFGILFSEAL